MTTAMAFMDEHFDEARGLLWNMPGAFDDKVGPPHSFHLVQQSPWYALGLFERGDADTACRVVEALCELQYDEPGTPWHGTFARFAEWPRPTAGAVEWVDYDPNWRQFVGTSFKLALRRFDVPAATAGRMEAAIALACAGEPRDRVPPWYSNIALMKAWLEDDVEYGAQVAAEFDRFGAFEEYNSPTYYGVDLYGLALWRDEWPAMSGEGGRLFDALWADVGRWYHPEMRNLCGPWSRAYGMDMRSYLSQLGLWIGDAVPDLDVADATFGHAHDLCFQPLVDLFGGQLGPPAAHPFPRLVEQELPNGRVATGWLSEKVMIGAEGGGLWPSRGQYHPAVAHWVEDDGSVGWLRVVTSQPVRAHAGEGTLTVEGGGETTLVVRGRSPFALPTGETSDAGSDGGGVTKLRLGSTDRLVLGL